MIDGWILRRQAGGVEAVMRAKTQDGDALMVFASPEPTERGRVAHGSRFAALLFVVAELSYPHVVEMCEERGMTATNLYCWSYEEAGLAYPQRESPGPFV